ncbi:multidrug/biocide efflux PACE transporter [Aquitalea denitrificans]|uniref:multidrug/biocide efflux PACE transporter n=1 Tax=Aquitalea denitrificans TaxID=519081 RepID=UPI0013597FF9|nr:multidrug/biocide efflux PACE transporter [Aquitalea denitrificans]
MSANDKKHLGERILHAVLYEVCAMVMLVPLAALLTGSGVSLMGVLALMMSCVAMLFNMLFNALFERAERHWGLQRTRWVRCAHALLFEGGLVVMLVPLAAWWLETSLWQALLLDLGFFAFFLPYTYLFNLAYDHLRQRVMQNRQTALPQTK